MSALPSDIARFTTDGIVIRAPLTQAASDAIKAEHVDAQDVGDGEIEMFFDNPADAQIMLNERFAILSRVDPVHIGIEVEESLRIGDAIAITPAVPRMRVIDAERGVDEIVRVRAFAHDMETDRYSVEVMS